MRSAGPSLLALALMLVGCHRPPRSPCAETGWGPLVKIAAGNSFTCGLTRHDVVLCWGSNGDHQLGDASGASSTTPRHVIEHVADVAAGWAHACAVHRDGTVSCWGFDGLDALVDETKRPGHSTATPWKVAGLADATSIACRGFTCCALRTNGHVACFGDGTSGQLGDGARGVRADARDVIGLDDAVQVTVSGVHACARRRDGTIACWGGARGGRLGDGSVVDRPYPGVVPGVRDATWIAAGALATCAITRGDVVCWGSKPSAFGDDEAPVPPTSIGFLASFDPATLESGETIDSPVCVVSTGGEVACLGRNLEGQLGDGSKENRRGLVRVEDLDDVASIAVGGAHVCALRADGELRCWGRNARGQLGDGTTVTRTRPTRAFFRTAWANPERATHCFP